MKTVYTLSTVLFLFLFSAPFLQAHAQDDASAVTYMNKFSEQYKLISKETWDYTNAVARGKKARKIENKRQELLQSIKAAERRLKVMDGFNGHTGLRDTIVSYLNLSYTVMDEDYGKIMDMEEIAEQSYDLMEAFLLAKELAGDKLSEANGRVNSEVKAFAASNDINLIESENELQKKLKVANEVFDYNNKIYLIFFKSYKQEAYLLDALNANDLNGIEQNKSALSTNAKEGLEKLPKIKSFKGDASIMNACSAMLRFYRDEADKQFPIITDFYLSKEKFEKLKVVMESKKKKDITEEDVNQYNVSIEEMNAKANAYNEVNDELNKKRSKLLKEWNDMTAKFLDRQIP